MDANPASADLYERLGISPDAKPEEVRTAFKAMRKELHPDSRPESLRGHFDAMMKNVNEAHQTLTDVRARAKYDAKRTYRAQAQEAEQDAARERSQQRRQEEARRREREDEHRRRREAEARERQRHEEEDRRRAEDEARAGDEDESDSWEYADDEFARDFAGGDAAAEDPARREAAGEPATPTAGVMDRIPGVGHRAMIYVAGSWVWLTVTWAIASLPFWGASLIAFGFAVVVPVGAGVAGLLLLKAAPVIGVARRVAGFVIPTRVFTGLWFLQRILESAVLAPVMIFVAALISGIYALLSFAAFAYVVVWGVELYRWRQSRQEMGR